MTALSAWREEGRRDRLVGAQIERDREAARAQLRITEAHARIQARREAQHARMVARQQARKARQARRAARVAWLNGHVVDLLFVPVIGVPGALAWSSMAAYGLQVYGTPGLALPAFSEGAMWAFAAATTITRRHHPDRPVWHLRLGTLVFAAYGAVLNFTHGLTAPSGPHGLGIAVVMAVVSVAGVVAHQLVTAGPRRSREQRAQDRIARVAARREMAARKAAIRRAAAEVDEHGRACLVYAPGRYAPGRRGQAQAGPGGQPFPLAVAGPVCPWPRQVPVLPAQLPGLPGAVPEPVPGPVPGRVPARAPRPVPERAPRVRTRTRTRKRTRAVTAEAAEVHFAADLADGQVPSIQRIKAGLHVGQDRAKKIQDHLAAVAGTRPAAA